MQHKLGNYSLGKTIALSLLCSTAILANAATVTFTPIGDVTISTQTKGNGQNGNPDDRRFMGVSDFGHVLAVNKVTGNVFVWDNQITYNLGPKDCDNGSTSEPTHIMNISRDGSNTLWRCTDNGSAKRSIKSEAGYEPAQGPSHWNYYPSDIDTHIASKDGNAVRLAKTWQHNELAVLSLDSGGVWRVTALTAPQLGSGQIEAFSPNGRYVGVRKGYTYYVVNLADQSIADEYTDNYVMSSKIFISNSGKIILSKPGYFFQDSSGDANTRLQHSGHLSTSESTIWTSWTESDRYIDDFVIQNNGNLQGWSNLRAVSISQNGLYITGVGTNSNGEPDKGFLLEIDPTSECTYSY
jgi:hypothetical protein